MTRRARSVAHVEYELLNFIGERLYVDDLMQQMIPEGDKVAKKRLDKGATNISTYLRTAYTICRWIYCLTYNV